jgi:hypothetical protein
MEYVFILQFAAVALVLTAGLVRDAVAQYRVRDYQPRARY